LANFFSSYDNNTLSTILFIIKYRLGQLDVLRSSYARHLSVVIMPLLRTEFSMLLTLIQAHTKQIL